MMSGVGDTNLAEQDGLNVAHAPLLSEPIGKIKKGAGFGVSVFMLMNCILGEGLLALPHALSKSGVVFFFFLFVVMALCAWYSIRLLLKACVATNTTGNFERTHCEGHYYDLNDYYLYY